MRYFIVTFIVIFGFFSTASVYASTDKSWNFRVFLDEKEIGYHNVNLSTQKNIRTVSVEANFAVKFLFINAYEYEHQTQESWNGNCLTELSSDTNDNGEFLFLRAKSSGNSVELITHDGETELEGCIRSFAYWNPDLLKSSKLLNTQTGEYQPVEFVEKGLNTLDIEGEQIEALLYQLTVDDETIDLWYTTDKNWLALQTKVRGGRLLSYFPARSDI